MQPRQIEVNGIPISYVDDGRGEPVVFVHRAAGDLRVWEPIREAVVKQHRFVAPTLRYFGTVEWPDKGGRFSVATHADDIAAFIEALDLGPVHLVGWSYGGNIATTVALEHPDGGVAEVVGIGGRRNLRVPRSTDRRLRPPRRSRHEGRYRDRAMCATRQRQRA